MEYSEWNTGHVLICFFIFVCYQWILSNMLFFFLGTRKSKGKGSFSYFLRIGQSVSFVVNIVYTFTMQLSSAKQNIGEIENNALDIFFIYGEKLWSLLVYLMLTFFYLQYFRLFLTQSFQAEMIMQLEKVCLKVIWRKNKLYFSTIAKVIIFKKVFSGFINASDWRHVWSQN